MVEQVVWLLCFLWAWLFCSSVALPIVSRVDVSEPGAGAIVQKGYGRPGAPRGSTERVSYLIRRARIDGDRRPRSRRFAQGVEAACSDQCCRFATKWLRFRGKRGKGLCINQVFCTRL